MQQGNSQALLEAAADATAGEYVAVPSESLLGELEIRILAYALSINGAPASSGAFVHPGDRVGVTVRAASLRRFPQTVFGLRIADESGRVVATGNNASSSLQIFGLEPGISTLRLTFQWPDSGRGTYRLTIGVGEGADGDHNIVQCWADSCCVLNQIPSRESSSVTSLRILSAERN
jgi:hypothetical protein